MLPGTWLTRLGTPARVFLSRHAAAGGQSSTLMPSLMTSVTEQPHERVTRPAGILAGFLQQRDVCAEPSLTAERAAAVERALSATGRRRAAQNRNRDKRLPDIGFVVQA